jgi:hypothetical protein
MFVVCPHCRKKQPTDHSSQVECSCGFAWDPDLATEDIAALANAHRMFEACAALAIVCCGDPIGVFDHLPHGLGKNSQTRQMIFQVWTRRCAEFPFDCPSVLTPQ